MERGVVFRQPGRKCTFEFRNTCARPMADSPELSLAWGARACTVIAAKIRRSAEPTSRHHKTESWRREPMLPNSRHNRNTGAPGQPYRIPLEPGARPTSERLIYPFEGETSNIEWAVINFLGKKYPEIYLELLEAACEYGERPEGDQ